MRRSATAVTLVAIAVLAGCGGHSTNSGVRPAEPLRIPGCSTVIYGGEGRPDHLIAASTSLHGPYIDHGIQTTEALKMVLAERRWRAGDYRVGLQICDEAGGPSSPASPAKCRRNARAFARNRRVLAVIGPHLSSCAGVMLPILNRAPDGPLVAISGSTTYLGLTRSGPGVAPGDPERNFPTGRRSFVRLVPADDAQAAAAVLFAKQSGSRRGFALTDGETYGSGLADAFATAAERVGIPMVGRARWSAGAHSYGALARRIKATKPDVVFLGGYISSNGPRLIRDLRSALGDKVLILGPDAFMDAAPIVEGAGTSAEGFAGTIAVLPVETLPPAGRDFATRFQRRFGSLPCCFSVHTAQATYMLLDAIAASHGRRANIAGQLFGAHVDNGLLGTFDVDKYGDTTQTTIGVYRIQGGRLRFIRQITPPGNLLARR
jgi:branched-chain amino acid transport system substrate-binding protein